MIIKGIKLAETTAVIKQIEKQTDRSLFNWLNGSDNIKFIEAQQLLFIAAQEAGYTGSFAEFEKITDELDHTELMKELGNFMFVLQHCHKTPKQREELDKQLIAQQEAEAIRLIQLASQAIED